MINGKRSYIVFKKVADNYIGVAVTVTFSRMCLGISSWLAVMKLKKNHLENK